MPTITVTEPVMTDSTGQQILTALNALKTAVAPTDAYLDVDLTLTTSGWSNATPSVYTWSSNNVTDDCGVEVAFANGSESVYTPYIEYEKGTQSVVFYAPTKPTANIPVIVRIIYAKAESVTDIDAEMVSTDAVSGASNVQDALESVNSRVGSISEQMAYKADVICNHTDWSTTHTVTIDSSKRAFILSACTAGFFGHAITYTNGNMALYAIHGTAPTVTRNGTSYTFTFGASTDFAIFGA